MGYFFFYIRQDRKKNLLETFWGKIRDFSSEISSTTLLLSGHTVDYFDILKNRMDRYLNSLIDVNYAQDDPVAIIGPKFAKVCSLEGDACVILAGSKLFNLAIAAVKEYLNFAKESV